MEESSQPQIVLMPNGQQVQHKPWIEACKDLIARLKALKPEDRLACASSTLDCILDIMASMQGFMTWYKVEFGTGQSKPLSALSLDELKVMFEFFQSTSINVLEFDIAITKIVEDKYKQKLQPKKEKLKNESHGVVV